VLGLVFSLGGAEDPTAETSGSFILFNFVGACVMGLLVGSVVRMPAKLFSAMVGVGVFCLGIIFLVVWENYMSAQDQTGAVKWVKVWTLLNIMLLGVLIVYSWLNRPDDEPGLLANWIPTLNSAACFGVGALFYLYMPIASMTNPPMNWAYPRTLGGFEHAFTRGQYDKIDPSNFTRMFVDHTHLKGGRERPDFNGGQTAIFLDEAQEEFSLSYMALALIPLAFIHRMRHREIRWIVGLITIFIFLTFSLIYVLNPTDDEQNRHLYKVFFAATHIFIAIGLGLGLALLGAAIAQRWRQVLPGLAIFLAVLAAVEVYKTTTIFQKTVFPIPRIAAVIGLALILVLTMLTGLFAYVKKSNLAQLAIVGAIITLPLLPLRPALNNWAENEQRGHLYGFWYGHDMFTPPFDIYPEMDKGAILFGGTDPGRFCPTYMIFCESFIADRNKRDPDFDRRDVYIITQNALADSTYLEYIRAHYNRSAQIDPPFFSALAAKINDSKKRGTLTAVLYLGALLGALILVATAIKMRNTHWRDTKLIGTAGWGLALFGLCATATPGPLTSITESADKFFGGLGARVEASRRAAGVYPEKEINTPSTPDNQAAFTTYLRDAQERMLANKLRQGENVTLVMEFKCPYHGGMVMGFRQQNIRQYHQAKGIGGMPCPHCLRGSPQRQTLMPMPEPQVRVQGNTSVMALNALLAKTMFDTNRDHSFYIEESFALDWMYPYLEPYGIIMKLDAEREFEIGPVTPPETPAPGFKPGDVLTPMNSETDTRLDPLANAKITVGSISTNGVIQSINVENGGKYEIEPARATYAIGLTTNHTTAKVQLEMEPIPGTPSQRITAAAVDPEYPHEGYRIGDRLTLQTGSSYQPIQYQGTDAAQFLEVAGVNEAGAITDLTVLDNGGRFIVMPPTEITFANTNGVTFRAVVDFRRIPKHRNGFPQEMLDKDRQFWSQYSERLIGNWITETTTVKEICDWNRKTYLRRNFSGFTGNPTFVRDNDAQKGFSKLRSAIASLYAWRHRITTDPIEKERYAAAADFAYRQALAFGPINPEVSFKYVQFLNTVNRFDDAVLVARTLEDIDPNSDSGQRLLYTAYAIREANLRVQLDFTNAAAMALSISRLQKLDALTRSQALARYTNLMQFGLLYQEPVQLFREKPDSLIRFNRAVRIYYQLKKTDDLANAIELFANNAATNAENAIALQNAYQMVGDWKSKLKYDLLATEREPEAYMPWFDVAVTHLKLEDTNASAAAMVKSLKLHDAATNRSVDIRGLVRTNATFAPLREIPEIKKMFE